MKTTKKELQIMFNRFLKTIGERPAEHSRDEDGFNLEHNSVYKGYMIDQITNDKGAIRHPFINLRMSKSEMYQCLWFACNVIEYYKGNWKP